MWQETAIVVLQKPHGVSETVLPFLDSPLNVRKESRDFHSNSSSKKITTQQLAILSRLILLLEYKCSIKKIKLSQIPDTRLCMYFLPSYQKKGQSKQPSVTLPIGQVQAADSTVAAENELQKSMQSTHFHG